MHLLLHFPLLGLALLSPSILALTIPLTTPTNISQTSNGLNVTVNSGITCTKRDGSVRIQPGFADCAGALRLLPLNPSAGTFYNQGRGDFQLPYFDTYKTCTVLVSLRSPLDRVQSSWLAVQVAAMELNEACQDVRAAPGLGSATTFVDGLNSMRITLQGPRRELGDGGDGGDGATETS